MTILERVKLNAKNNPDRIAVRADVESGELIMTWGELDEMSDRLATYLKGTLNTKSPVVVYGHKNPMMLACFLACVKSGRAYCPVDMSFPKARIEAIIKDIEPEMVLATEDFDVDGIAFKNCQEIKDIINTTEANVDDGDYVKAEDVFYIIFTSGSTGTPKGVQITRRCLDNFIKWAITLGNGFDDSRHRIFLNQALLSFDLSVMDVYLSLYTGGTLWSLDKGVQSNLKLLYESLAKSNVNVWVSTPSFADICLFDQAFSAVLMNNVTDFLFCGEVLSNKTAEQLHERFPNAKIVNTYGPTESTCAVTEIEITDDIVKKYSPLPVGMPKPGTYIWITDSEGNRLPDGEVGEIVIVGDSVGVGYWKKDELNRTVFGVTNVGDKQYRMYKTGDAGCIRSGMLHYVGRMDNQVKLHGYRIELGDIESNLLRIEGVRRAVVLPKHREGKVDYLVAGIVYEMAIENEKRAIKDIKNELKKSLPDYMIPKIIRFVSDIPMTHNGKADRAALAKTLNV